MTSKTHSVLGLTTALILIKFYPDADIYVSVSGGIIGALLPDLDTQKSSPSQIFPLVSLLVDKVTRHRGATHSILPAIFLLVYLFQHKFCWLALGLGALSHVVIDTFTKSIGVTCQSRGENVIYWIVWIINFILIGGILWIIK
jgi:membrane-bound metal-dependent hydrolase YbcI (DUF457 family)